MKLHHRLASGLASSLFLAALTTGTALAADTIKIGLLEDISGDLALIGKPKLNGSQLAVEEINKAGGILGKQKIGRAHV